jgi:hypothetical protein
MRAIVDWSLIFVAIIVIAMFIFAAYAIPKTLQALGLKEYGDLEEKLLNLQKYREEGVTLYLPEYVERIEFIHGTDGKCSGAACDLCGSAPWGTPLTGNTFITIRINKEKLPSWSSVLWKTVTLDGNGVKNDMVKMVVNDQCLPKDFESSFETNKYINTNGVMVLPGDPRNIKAYCIRIQEKTGRRAINVAKEEGC